MVKDIKVIAFDIGSVVTKTNHNLFYRSLDKLAIQNDVDPKEFEELRIKYGRDSFIGKISDSEIKLKIMKKLGVKDKRDFAKKWDNALDPCMKLNKEVYFLLTKLKKQYTLVSFSNVSPMFHKMRIKKGVYNHFKFNLLSHQEGMRKPDVKFYKLLIKKLKVKPNQIIFIDDRTENLIPAKKLGMKVILYKNNRKLIKDLERLGVKVK